MILVDWSHLLISCYFAHEREMGTVEDDVFRKHVVHTLVTIQSRFRHPFGQVFLCCDSGRSWRYQIYPHYKSMRKLTKADDALKWADIERLKTLIMEEIKTNVVFPVVQVKHAEADDVIAILATEATSATIIVSEDKDYHQLHRLPHISQYSHRRESVYRVEDPEMELREKIITGDRGDSIPNVHSKDDVFVLKERQTVVSAKRKAVYVEAFRIGEDGIPKEYEHNFERNKRLIDFAYIPQELRTAILDELSTVTRRVIPTMGSRTVYLMSVGISPSAL